MKNVKICHLTSVHKRNDTRIFLKQCCSLKKKFQDVTLIVADNLGNEIINGVNVIDVKPSSGRIARFLKTTDRVYKKAIEVDADIYHFHDPELIPIGLKLKKLGKTVIYDSHEDVSVQILSKPYINIVLRKIISSVFEKYEKRAARKLNAVVTATPFIKNRFLKFNKNSVDINNFPILGELEAENTTADLHQKKNLCYVGGISRNRGIFEIIHAMEHTTSGLELLIAGQLDEQLVEELKTIEGWNKVKALGQLNRPEVKNVMANSFAGLVTLYPIRNYLDSLPIKMFEYMIAGLPVIASNFDYWKEIIEPNNCGICVDPKNPIQIAEAANYLFKNPEIAFQMGQNGKKLVYSKYNWAIEEEKLYRFYDQLIE